MKGALLSGLIIPGLGQIVLKRYIRGTLLIVAVLGGLAILVMKTVQLALVILEKLQAQDGAITLGTITKAATQASMNHGSLSINLLFVVILACWIIGVIDAYSIGKKMDLAIAEETEPQGSDDV